MSDVEVVEMPKVPPGPRGMYRYVSAATEAPTTSDRQSTYGVQFAWKPCKEYLQGGGSFWKGRNILDPDLNPDDVMRAQSNDTADNGDGVGDDIRDEDINNDRDVDDSVEHDNAGDRAAANGKHAKDPSFGADVDVDDEISPQNRPGRSSSGPANPSFGNKHWRDLFVTCNGNAIRIYEAKLSHRPRCLQRYEDDDATEIFYCVGWTYNADGHHEWWACAAGRKGVVRVINVQNASLQMTLAGHGEAINDLKIHPRDPSLILTASKDESLRLWNLRTGITIAIFAGLKGHRGEVVFADFSHDGSRFASCGIDNSVRIWDIYDDDKVVNAIKDSHHVADLKVEDAYIYIDETGTRRKTKVVMSQFPYFVTRKVHKHYVDCVMWVGDLLLSKSVHNRMFLWEPESDRESLASPACNYSLLEEYVLDVCNVWFIRFSMDRTRRLVACGNDKVSSRLSEIYKLSN